MRNKVITITKDQLNVGTIIENSGEVTLTRVSPGGTTTYEHHFPARIHFLNKSGATVKVNILDKFSYEGYKAGDPNYDLFSIVNGEHLMMGTGEQLPLAYDILVQIGSGETATGSFNIEMLNYYNINLA